MLESPVSWETLSNKRVSKKGSLVPEEKENGETGEIGWSQSSQGFVCCAVFPLILKRFQKGEWKWTDHIWAYTRWLPLKWVTEIGRGSKLDSDPSIICLGSCPGKKKNGATEDISINIVLLLHTLQI